MCLEENQAGESESSLNPRYPGLERYCSKDACHCSTHQHYTRHIHRGSAASDPEQSSRDDSVIDSCVADDSRNQLLLIDCERATSRQFRQLLADEAKQERS